MENKIMPKVFGWMFVGLFVTFLTGYFVSTQEQMLATIFGTGWFFGIIIAEFVLVIFLSTRIRKMQPVTAKIAFLLYSFVSGLTFSTVFITYEMESVMFVFLIAAVIFGIFAVLGSVTQKDLTKLGNFLLMALIGVIICVIVNLFLNSSSFDLILSIAILLIFIGFTAYDVKKIKEYASLNALAEDNLAIYGALELYLDFINIFLELLQLFGKQDN